MVRLTSNVMDIQTFKEISFPTRRNNLKSCPTLESEASVKRGDIRFYLKHGEKGSIPLLHLNQK
jgi:hypothetical protein